MRPAADGGAIYLYITYDGLLEPLGQSQVLPYVRGLARDLDVPVQVISFEKPQDLDDPERAEALHAALHGSGVVWHPLRYHAWPSLPATAWDVVQGLRHGRRLLRSGRPCLVHARSYVPGLIALLLKRRLDVPFVFDMRGFWVDERVEGGVWPAHHAVVPVARRVERSLLSAADAVVSLTEAGRRVLAEGEPPVRSSRVRVIPTCVDLERFRPAADPAARRRELGLGDGPLLVYVGSLSTWYMGDLTLQVARAWVERSGGRFLVLTRERELAEDLGRRHGVEVMVRTAAHGEVPGWIGAADAGLSLVRPVPSKRASAPTKVGEYLACGLAVAATAVGDLDAQLAGSDVAFTLRPEEDPMAITERLLTAARRPGRTQRARDLAEHHFGLDAGVAAYAALYREISACV